MLTKTVAKTPHIDPTHQKEAWVLAILHYETLVSAACEEMLSGKRNQS